MNQFRFDSHDNRYAIFFTALIAGIVGAFLVILAVKFTGLGVALVNPQVEPAPSPAPFQSQSMNINNYEKSVIGVYNRVSPSVVMITTNTIVESFDFFFGPDTARNIRGLGSGVVFRKDGYILTNNHVAGKADRIMVVLPNGKTYEAKIVGVDAHTDLAVLKIDNNNLPVPGWGDSNKVVVGQTAIAIGNPLAENLKNTVTVGVISAKGRTLKVSENNELYNMIQTDASINPGNSGGPLLDSNGNIIGINTAIAADSQGIGFSIPSNTAKIVGEQLISRGYVTRPGIGISYIHLTAQNTPWLEYQIRKKLPVNRGMLIAKVISDSPADRVGLMPGDIIVKLNNHPIPEEGDLIREAILKYRIGTKLTLEIFRNNKLHRVTVEIGEIRS